MQYIENFHRFPRLTNLLNQLKVRYVTIKDVIVPIKYGNTILEVSPMSNIDNKNENIDTGIYNINVYFKESLWFILHNKHPTKVIPDLDNPGIRAIIWNSPIIMASLIVISVSFFNPLEFLTNSKEIAVINKHMLISLIDIIFSIESLNNSPIIPTGIEDIINLII